MTNPEDDPQGAMQDALVRKENNCHHYIVKYMK